MIEQGKSTAIEPQSRNGLVCPSKRAETVFFFVSRSLRGNVTLIEVGEEYHSSESITSWMREHRVKAGVKADVGLG